MLTWVTIIFHSASKPKTHCDVTRIYDKFSCLCLELERKDASGNPIILAYPWCNVFSWAHPHRDHVGMEERA